MYKILTVVMAWLLCCCTDRVSEQPSENPLVQSYKPGLGEFMSGIQTHHAKLWYAGINENWKLSEYELDEIREMFQAAEEFESERSEVKNIPMIYEVLDSVTTAVKEQDAAQFKNSFHSLTNTCNSCHRKVNFEFNVITIPTAPPVTNQDFKAE